MRRWMRPRNCQPSAFDLLGLGHQLLRVVLAHVGEPRGEGLLDRVGAEALGHRHHAHPVEVTAGSLDAGAHLDQPLGDAHGSSQTTPARRATSARARWE